MRTTLVGMAIVCLVGLSLFVLWPIALAPTRSNDGRAPTGHGRLEAQSPSFVDPTADIMPVEPPIRRSASDREKNEPEPVAPISVGLPDCRIFGRLVEPPYQAPTYALWTPVFSVYAMDARGRRIEGNVNESGEYELQALQAGQWSVTAHGIEHCSSTALVALVPGESRRLDILLRPKRMIDVLLADNQGTLIPASSPVFTWHVVASEDGRSVAQVPYSIIDSLQFIGTAFPLQAGASARDVVHPDGEVVRMDVVPSLFLANFGDRIVCRLAISDGASMFVTMLINDIVIDCQEMTDVARLVFAFPNDAYEMVTGGLRFALSDGSTGPVDHPAVDVSWVEGSITIPIGTGRLVHIRGLLPGEREVAVDGAGVEARVRQVWIPPSGEVDLGTLDIELTGRIAGRVRAVSGEPVANARIGCWKKDERTGAVEQVGQYGWKVDAQGEFVIPVANGQHFVRVADGRGAGNLAIGSQSVGVWVSGKEERVELTALLLEQVVCTATGGSTDHKVILFLDGNGVPLLQKAWTGQGTLVGLPPGETEYRAYDVAGTEMLRRRLVVGPGAHIDL